MKNSALKTEALIIAEITGSITSEEKAELDDLMKASSEVRALSEEMHKVLDPEISEIRKIRNTSAKKIIELGNAQLHERGRIRRLTIVSFAAACLAGILLAVFLYTGRNNKTEMLFAKGQNVWLDLGRKVIALSGQGGVLNTAGSFSYNGDKTFLTSEVVDGNDSIKLIVPVGREYKITLSDGTLVHLNSGSVLSWRAGFGNGSRDISLRGEAFLEVAKDERLPFRVHLSNETVDVLGTKINVRAYNERSLQISLIDGSINVNRKEQRVHLKRGEEVVYSNEQLKVQPSDTTAVLQWKRANIDLLDAGVEDIEKAVLRYYGEKLEFDPAIRGKRTRVSIDRNVPVEDFLEQYALVNGLKYSKEDGIYRLSLLQD
jgi:ferric-dicitrate binding protein FerR (iron transport regulator)